MEVVHRNLLEIDLLVLLAATLMHAPRLVQNILHGFHWETLPGSTSRVATFR